MKPNKLLKLLLLIGCLLLPFSSVWAHDPGMSRSSVQLQNAGLTIQMVFARQDLESLILIDADFDGSVSVNEFSLARAQLQSLISDSIILRYADRNVLPARVQLEQSSEDAVSIELFYNATDSSAISLQLPLIAQLARGHRQYLTVLDENRNLLAQHILNASSPLLPLGVKELDGFDIFRDYLLEGVWHIWIGFDHILFLLTLLLPAVLVYRKSVWQSVDNLRPAVMDTLKIVTAFTVAHSITLALAVLGIVSLPAQLVEPAIALSVLVTALNNLRPVFPTSRWSLAFIFGLVHGFGFASVLVDLGLPDEALAMSLLGFNLGVEAGQLAIVACVFPIMVFLRHTRLYRTWMFSGGSTMAAFISAVWIFERIFDYEVLVL